MLYDLALSSDTIGMLTLIVTAISTLISIGASIYIFKTTPKYQLVKERYDNLIFPLFQLIEPHMYSTYDPKILNKSLELITNNKSIAGSKLYEISYYCEINPNQDHYNILCRIISQEYDYCCVRLGLKKRSIGYRLGRRQYKTKLMFIPYIIYHTLIFIVIMISSISTFGLVLHLLFQALSNIQLIPR